MVTWELRQKLVRKTTGVDFGCAGKEEEATVDFAECWMGVSSRNDIEGAKGLAYLDNGWNLVVPPFPDLGVGFGFEYFYVPIWRWRRHWM